MAMRTILTLAARELSQRLHDGTAMVVAFVAPVVMASLLSYALGSGHGTTTMTLAVADTSHGTLGTRLSDGITNAPALHGSVTVRRYDDNPEQARTDLVAGRVDAVLLLAPDCATAPGPGSTCTVTVLESRDKALAGIVARSAAGQLADAVNGTALAVSVSLAAGVPADQVGTHVAQVTSANPGPALAGATAGPPAGGAAYYGPGMALLFAFFVVGTSMRGVFTEFQLGTLARMRAMSVPYLSVIVGKGLVGFLLALVSMCVTWLSSLLLFGVSWGPPVAVAAVLVADALAAAAIMALVAAGARTESQANGYPTLVAFILAMLGGNFVAVYQLPSVLAHLALATPNGWAMRAFSTLTVGGGGLVDVLLPVSVLLAVAVVCTAAAAVRFRRGVLA